MNRIILLILVLLMLILDSNAQTSKIIFYRDCKFFGAGVSPNIYLSDTVVGEMKHQTFKIIEIPAKSVEFYSYIDYGFIKNPYPKLIKFKLNLVPNSTYFVNYSLEGVETFQPVFRLVNREQLKLLALRRKLKNDLIKNNIKIEDINLTYIDTIRLKNQFFKLLYDQSLWMYQNIPLNTKWDSHFITSDKTSEILATESNKRIKESDLIGLVKTHLDNFIIDTISYKTDTINGISSFDVSIDANYSEESFIMRERIYNFEEGSYCLLSISKKKYFDKNQPMIIDLFNGLVKYK